MNGSAYRIRKSFLVPMGLTVLLGCVLLVSGVFLQVPVARQILLALFILPAVLIFIESRRRIVRISSDHVVVEKVLRTKRIDFKDLTSVDAVRIRKRVFISLSTEDSFLIISNGYERFGQLVQELVRVVPESTLSDEARQLAQDPPQKCSDIFSAWVAVAVLTLIIITQFRSAF